MVSEWGLISFFFLSLISYGKKKDVGKLKGEERG